MFMVSTINLCSLSNYCLENITQNCKNNQYSGNSFVETNLTGSLNPQNLLNDNKIMFALLISIQKKCNNSF